MAVITAILALIGALLPLASILTFLVVAIPIIIVIVRNNLATGIIASLVAAFLVGIIAGPIIALLFYVQFMGLALAYGVLFKKKVSPGRILIIGTVVATVSIILLMTLTLWTSQISLEQQREGMYEMIGSTIQFYEDSGWIETFEEQGMSKEDIRDLLTLNLDLFFRLLPAMLVIASIISALVHFKMARMLLKRTGFDSPAFPAFREWRLPWYTIWGVIIGWGSYLAGDYYGSDFWMIVGQNIMTAYGIVLFILGFAVIIFFLKKYHLSFMLRILIFLFILLMFNLAILLIILIGMFDLILDYRKLNKNKIGKG